MLSQLKDIIPGAEHWPRFLRNRSEQFEARFGLLEVAESPSLFFAGMHGSRIPVAIAHGEGRATFDSDTARDAATVALRYVANDGSVAVSYPANPNGSESAIAGLSSRDGRATILMPHPERTPRSVNMSWHPDDWPEDSPWPRMFRNARIAVGLYRFRSDVARLSLSARAGAFREINDPLSRVSTSRTPGLLTDR